jgi:FixJ family two-component response regulator
MIGGRVQIAVVDDDEAARTSLVRLLTVEGYHAHGFATPAAFLAAAGAQAFGCAVLDLRMPGMTGLELQRALAVAGHAIPVLFLSAFGTIPETVRAMQDGAIDFLEKPVRPEALLDGVRRAVGTAHDRLAAQTRHVSAAARVALLSPREREVMQAVARGRLNKQIAAELGITVRTVKFHRARVMEKTGVESVPDLVRLLDDSSTPPAPPA